jgi:hypothetical protein
MRIEILCRKIFRSEIAQGRTKKLKATKLNFLKAFTIKNECMSSKNRSKHGCNELNEWIVMFRL